MSEGCRGWMVVSRVVDCKDTALKGSKTAWGCCPYACLAGNNGFPEKPPPGI